MTAALLTAFTIVAALAPVPVTATVLIVAGVAGVFAPAWRTR